MTNEEFARTIEEFRYACMLARVPPTRRQASKFRRSKGAAYKALFDFDSPRFKRGEHLFHQFRALFSTDTFAGALPEIDSKADED